MGHERILVVEDEADVRGALRSMLVEHGYEALEASDGEEGLELIRSFSPELVIADVRLPGMDGLRLLERARESGSDAPFVMMTGFGTIEAAVEAMRAGAENYLVKPVDLDAALVLVGKALQLRRLRREADGLRTQVHARLLLDGMVGESPEMQAVYELLAQAAPTRATVLVLGESGTGKELIAQALHQSSLRRAKPFIRVSCAALSDTLLESELFGHEKGAFTGAVARREGRFELADGGTLFLDEIGAVPPITQAKLLRVLQQREFERVGGTQTLKVDVRLIAATNRDLAAEVKLGKFREDLFYRLNVVAVTLPPLRRRKGDIPALVMHFIERSAEAYGKKVTGVAPGFLQTLIAHDWPGNVRELENAVERAVVLVKGTLLTSDYLPSSLGGPRHALPRLRDDGAGATLYAIEREAILGALDRAGGSTAKAAEILQISLRKVQYRLKEYGTAPVPLPE
jgi:two-component system NtrC family response regulator